MSAASDEQQYVHQVYDHIASHFSDTRYKPWPLISDFLESCPPGALGLDSGTGNGKYLGHGSVIAASEPKASTCKTNLMIGLDRSFNLLKIAQSRGHEVVQSDCSAMPWRRGLFDFCISIATIHHLTTPERRRQAVEDLILAVSPSGGRVFIQVWALEQGEESSLSRRKRLETATLSTNNNDPAHASPAVSPEQDVFVPWSFNKKPAPDQVQQQTFKRYYHLFKKEELRLLCLDAAHHLGLQDAVSVHSEGWERGNWWIQLQRSA